MSNPNRYVALQNAANYRHDVRKFDVDHTTSDFRAVRYDAEHVEGRIVWEDYDPSDCLCDVLESILGPEPPIRNVGKRDRAAMQDREKWQCMKICDTVC